MAEVTGMSVSAIRSYIRDSMSKYSLKDETHVLVDTVGTKSIEQVLLSVLDINSLTNENRLEVRALIDNLISEVKKTLDNYVPKYSVTSRNVSNIEIVDSMPEHPNPSTLYILLDWEHVVRDTDFDINKTGDGNMSLSLTGSLTLDGQSFPFDGKINTESFVGPSNGWISWGDYGYSPPSDGRYKIIATSSPNVGWVAIYVWEASTSKFKPMRWSFGGYCEYVVELKKDDIVYFDATSYGYLGELRMLVSAYRSDEPLSPPTDDSTPPNRLIRYQIKGTTNAGDTFPSSNPTAVGSFVLEQRGWYVDENHGLTPPTSGEYEITISTQEYIGTLIVLPYYAETGAFGESINSSAKDMTVKLNLTPSDVFYSYVETDTYSGDVTLTIEAREV